MIRPTVAFAALTLASALVAQAGPRTVELTVTTDPPGGDIKVDGKPAGASIAILQVRPGNHKVEASWPGGAAALAIAHATPNGPLSVRLVPGMTAAPSAAAPAASAEGGKTGGCPPGQKITEDTAGHCCWEGQAWANARCVGVPTACPDGYAADAGKQSCEQKACEAGKVRVRGGTACCWPGQVFHKGRQACIGVPTSCPRDATVVGEACVEVPVGDDFTTIELTPEGGAVAVQAICPSLKAGELATYVQHLLGTPPDRVHSSDCAVDHRRFIAQHEPRPARRVLVIRTSLAGHPMIPRKHMLRLLRAKLAEPPGFTDWLDSMAAQIARTGKARGYVIGASETFSVDLTQGLRDGSQPLFFLTARADKIEPATIGAESVLRWTEHLALITSDNVSYLAALPPVPTSKPDAPPPLVGVPAPAAAPPPLTAPPLPTWSALAKADGKEVRFTGPSGDPAAGTYRLIYRSGAIRHDASQGFEAVTHYTSASGTECGFHVVGGAQGAGQIRHWLGEVGWRQGPTVAEVQRLNAGREWRLTHPGGPVTIFFRDDNFDDNEGPGVLLELVPLP